MNGPELDLEARLRSLAAHAEHAPMPSGPAVRTAANRRRQRRRFIAVSAASLAIVGVLLSGLWWWPTSRTIVPATGGGSPQATTTPTTTLTKPTTTKTVPKNTTTTTPTPNPSAPGVEASLNNFVAQQTAIAQSAATAAGMATPVVSVHSPPTADGGLLVAVAAFSYSSTGQPVKVLSFANGEWTIWATHFPDLGSPVQPQPDGLSLASGMPVSVADVTGNSPDFLIVMQAADNDPGVVVSQDASTWRYVPNSGPYATSDVVSRNPQFLDGKLVSTYDDCVPDCASGHSQLITWTYDAATAEFTAPTPSSGA